MKKKTGEENQALGIDRETRRQILKAAEQLFLAKGFKGVSMKDVAEVVQVTPAALYYHFPAGKEDLFMSMMQAMFEEWAEGVIHASKPGRNIRERLQLVAQYLLSLPFDHLPTLMQDAKEQIKDKEKQSVIFMQVQNAVTQHITNVFQQAIEAGEITSDIPAEVLALMYQGMSIALLQGLHLSTKGFERIDANQFASMVVSVLLNGIASPAISNE